MKWYGSVNNRMMENRQFVKEIKAGDGATEYLYSDSHAYEVTRVIDQNHIYIRRMDAKNKQAFANDWTYKSNPSNPEIELQRRNDVWYKVHTYNKDKMYRIDEGFRTPEAFYNYQCCMACLTDNQRKRLDEGKEVKKLVKSNISIGVMEEYYDWSF